jgi:hypothetical protein
MRLTAVAGVNITYRPIRSANTNFSFLDGCVSFANNASRTASCSPVIQCRPPLFLDVDTEEWMLPLRGLDSVMLSLGLLISVRVDRDGGRIVLERLKSVFIQ